MQERLKNNLFRSGPLNIALIYLVLGFLWIVYSDHLIEQNIDNVQMLTTVQTMKGWVYVSLTGLLLYGLIRKYRSYLTETRRDFQQKFDQYKALLGHANQVIIQVDQTGNFLYVNPVMEDVLGYSASHYRNLDDLEKILHKDDLGKYREIWHHWRDGDGTSIKRQVRIWHGNQSWHWFLLIAADERELQHVESWLLILRDIQEETMLYEELHESYAAIQRLNATLEGKVKERTRELKSLNKELESFAYSVSHDLRAPLRSIDGFSQALLDEYRDKLDKKGQKYLGRVRAATKKMGEQIDDILALSRITRTEFNRQPVDLVHSGKQIISALKEKFPDKKAEISMPDQMMVSGDPGLLDLLMQNLIENAWKFSMNKEIIKIDIGLDADDEYTTVYVKDNGVGFNMKYYDKLFDAFQRLHSQNEFSGTGIGLATAQRIVARHSGKIRAESEVGTGSVFYFSLPNRIEIVEER